MKSAESETKARRSLVFKDFLNHREQDNKGIIQRRKESKLVY